MDTIFLTVIEEVNNVKATLENLTNELESQFLKILNTEKG